MVSLLNDHARAAVHAFGAVQRGRALMGAGCGCRAVHEKWMAADNYELVIQDVVDEVWDMVKPAHPARITLRDLVACKQGDTVVSMLTDVRGFWQHDNRETLAQQQDDDDAGQF